MYLLCNILMIIAAVLMCIIVLVQNSKGGGLAAGFESSNQIMGVRKTTDFLEKTTWGLAAFMVFLSICSAYALYSNTAVGTENSSIMENAVNTNAVPDFSTPVESGEAVPEATTPEE